MNIYMRFPGGLAKAMTLSYDDQQRQDKRFVEILNKNGLKCTFNINSGYYGNIADKDLPNGRMSLEEMREAYRGHEVAVHSLTHPFLEQLPVSMVTEEVLGDRKNIERDFGGICRGMAYPYGTFNDTVVEALRACGIVYSRTIRATESFAIPRDWLRLDPTCHHANPRLFELFDRFFGNHNGRAPWLFYLWGHSFELDRNVPNNSWEHAEKFCERAGGHDDVWYATNIEIYDYIAAYKSLVWNANGTEVYNPTATDIWFAVDSARESVFHPSDKGTFCIHPGESLKLTRN